MVDTLNLEQHFAIVSEAAPSLGPVRVLKQGDTFAVFDAHGDVVPSLASPHGLYHAGTRFLSQLELQLGSVRPLLLSSTISADNVVFTADLTNPDIMKDEHVVLERGALHIFRSRVLTDGTWTECVRIANHALHPIQVPLWLRFDADFADVFEVRGTRRAAHGQRLPASIAADHVLIRYRGLDHVDRRTEVRPMRPPDRVDARSMLFTLSLEPHAATELEYAVGCRLGDTVPDSRRFAEAVADRRQQVARGEAASCRIVGANEAFNLWVRRSSSDLQMMITDTSGGPYPYAGIPWFSTPFGRDGLITAFELLWADPSLARGVLSFLGDTQATTTNDAQDAQPGKILHEMREGEMATLGEVPFGRYYGSADATPLFVALACAYFERTNDRPFIDRLWPHILAALEWMERYGDLDGDGFIEYARRSATGLVQQGWKDSGDSIFHATGALATAPIALCEIQGYAYAAWNGAAKLAAIRNDQATADRWLRKAVSLQQRFETAFWCEDLGTYALALDADKRPCRVRTSNPGHCLFTGIASREHAHRVSDALLNDASFSGWGVRTVAAGAARYNPMSYHNGSVWPHDNAIIAAGLARYGLTTAAARIFGAMFELSHAVDLHRLPELICGFHKRTGDAPTLYPVACAPQAWSAGAVYLLVQSCLGLRVDAGARRLVLERAVLPEAVDWLRIENLAVGEATVDLMLTRHANDVGVNVLRRTGELEVVSVN
jgi:glycogen debranching enzyme